MREKRGKTGMRFRKRLSAILLAAAMLLTSAQLPGGVSYAAGLTDGVEMTGELPQLDDAAVTDGVSQKEEEEVVTGVDVQPGSGDQPGDDSKPGESVQPGGGDQPGDDSKSGESVQSGSGEQAGEDGQPGEDAPAGDSSQTEEGSQPGDGDQPEDGNQPGDDNQTGDDTPGGDGQQGEDNPGGGSQPGSGDQKGDEGQPGDGQPGEDTQPDSEDKSEEGPDAEQVSGNDLESEADGEEAIALQSAVYDGSVEDYIYQQLLKRVKYIDLYGAGFHYVMDNPTRRLTEKHPELYHVNVLYSLLNENAVVRDDNGYIKALREEYYNDREEAKFRAAVEEALACVDNGMSDLEKVVALHDYLASHTKYDYETEAKIEYNIEHGINEEFVASTAYSALVNRFSVCGGYAYAYQYLLTQVGVESRYFTGTVDGKSHAWNLVKLNGTYYHVDVTWDNSGGNGRAAGHKYMLLSDDAIRRTHYWLTQGDFNAPDKIYDNALWHSVTAPLVFDGKGCYSLGTDGWLQRENFSAPGVKEKIAQVGGQQYSSGKIGLFFLNGRLFYNDVHSIYSVNPDGTDERAEFTLDTPMPANPAKPAAGEKYIYDCWYEDGKVHYYLAENTDPVTKEEKIAAIGGASGEYRIYYVLDGGTNDAANPSRYTVATDTIVLQAPAKEGYCFGGWYRDGDLMEERITQIPKGSTGNLTLCARWIPLNSAENPAYTFTTIDDRTVSSGAEGKPKLLLFFNPARNFSMRAVRSISGHIAAFDGVDIYAVEAGGNSTKEEVAQCREQNGGDGIIWCYDKDGQNQSYREAYAAHASVTTGKEEGGCLIVYIDKENRVQRVTDAVREWFGVIEILQDLCGLDRYYIRYQLEQGADNGQNPEIYQGGMDAAIALKAPVWGGSTFEGWYMDRALTRKIEKIPAGSRRNFTLYAKWKKDHEGLYAANPSLRLWGMDETIYSTKAEGRPKLLIFYTYMPGSVNGVVLKADDRSETIDGIREQIGDFVGVDIYAINTMARSNVSAYMEHHACDGITYVYGSDLENSKKPYVDAAKAAGITSDAVSARDCLVCYIDQYDNLQWVEPNTDGAQKILGNLKTYCGYEPQDGARRITYVLGGGRNSDGNPTACMPGERVSLKDPMRTGYRFEGWYTDAAFSKRVTEVPDTGDVKLYAKWTETGYNLPNPAYYDAVEFLSLDEQKVSQTADGKPKLLLFYMCVQTASRNTLIDISKRLSDFEGVDICAVDVSRLAKNKVEMGREEDNYVCDEIVCCYDTTTGNQRKLGTYMDVYGVPEPNVDEKTKNNITTLPAVCYIDADNRLRYLRRGAATADDILSDLQKYCDYTGGPEIYRITYELGGGTNHSKNPATYTAATAGITLQDATRKGYVFKGWYEDAAFQKKVTGIPKGSTGDITFYAKWEAASAVVTVISPARTTYKVGEELDITGGKVTVTPTSGTAKTYTMTADMLTGFDSSQAGLCQVTVTKDGYTGSFDVLVVEEPEITAAYGQVLLSVTLPTSAYGAYSWGDGVDTMQRLTKPGVYTFDAQFSPKDKTKFQTIAVQARVHVEATADGEEKIEITFAEKSFVYNGEEQKPEVMVTAKREEGEDILLTEGTDYTLSYKNNKNAGTATVTVKGIGEYTGEVSEDFIIEPAPLVIRAMDLVILVGDSIPGQYKYKMDGLFGEDELLKEPTLSCEIAGTETEGEYSVIPSGADAGGNYKITYENGVLRVVSERNTCKVVFDVQGHGKAPAAYTGISCGSTVDSPEEPTAEGYRFGGWYQDAECTLGWDFGNNTVQSDLTLYAKWLGVDSDGGFAVQEITDLTYNGRTQKPTVSVYDEDRLLKAGRDYTIKYYNNTNANAGGVLKGDTFNPALPYVAITGKGNYKETVKINFNILPASIGENYTPAAGVTLKVNDHLVKAARALTPFGSIKFRRSMKVGVDYELKLEAMITRDASGSLVFGSFDGAQVPAGYTGEFVLTVTGRGNYEGSISRNVYVADRDHLMKNVKVTLGKNLKNIAYTGSEITLKAVGKEKPADDEFVVTCGRTVLTPNEDYYVAYRNNTGAGKAELIVIGKDAYIGRKTVAFNIKGRTFSNGTVTVEGLQDNMPYTGRAVVQNKNAVLRWKEGNRKLEYGTDYTVSYSKNINKGTATISFTGKPEAGYSGTVKKTFKITAADIADTGKVKRAESMSAIKLPYSKAGVKPVEEIILTDGKGTRLRYGKDYTLAYKNNKAVADKNAGNAPTVTVKGKGNYSGSFDVKFTIEKADLNRENITVECTQAAYDSRKPDTYVYKPAVKVRDGKVTLKAGKDYEIAYEMNTQAECREYIENLLLLDPLAMPPENGRAVAVITAAEGSAYSLQEPIRIPLEIYLEKLTKNSLSVQIDPVVYTGGQVRPKVSVATDDGIPLKEGEDYMLAYGTNTASGKNKGSVTVIGLAPGYGGGVTYKFDIVRKDLKYGGRFAAGKERNFENTISQCISGNRNKSDADPEAS